MWIDEVTLIKESYAYDDIGNKVPTEISSTVFCEVKSIGMAEFYNAANTGLKPSIVFIVHSFEYEDQELIRYGGKKYNVIRTYLRNVDEVEIVCERVVGNG